METILSIDQGTTGTTAILLSSRGEILAKHTQEFAQIFPQPGWVEHDPEVIWGTVLLAIKKIFASHAGGTKGLRAIGITNQRETAVAWRAQDGKPLCNAIVWQCRRTAARCAQLMKKSGNLSLVQRRTGLRLDPYFSATKWEWMLKANKDLRSQLKSRQALLGTMESFLVYRFSGGAHVSDVSNASRTLLMNIDKLSWDDELCDLFAIPQVALPELVANNVVVARSKGVPGLPDGVPICGLAGDQQAALFGQVCFKKGDAKCTFGTGSFLLMNTGYQRAKSRNGLLETVAWRLEGQKPVYALEGGAFICGAAVQWLRDGLQIVTAASEIEALAASVADSGGVEFVPALSGLGAPHWDPGARGQITGLTRGTTRAHLARATLEALALQNVDLLRAMEKDMRGSIKALKVDGGATSNNLLMQLQANYLNRRVVRPVYLETTALGAAYLAGLGAGVWKSTAEVAGIWRQERIFTAALTTRARKIRFISWDRAIRSTRTHSSLGRVVP